MLIRRWSCSYQYRKVTAVRKAANGTVVVTNWKSTTRSQMLKIQVAKPLEAGTGQYLHCQDNGCLEKGCSQPRPGWPSKKALDAR